MEYSTNTSIGWIIIGIDVRPKIVESHGLWNINLVDLLCKYLIATHNLFIVNPGIIIDAKPCHIRVSDVEKNICFVLFDELFI
jgi:hypothetical protein